MNLLFFGWGRGSGGDAVLMDRKKKRGGGELISWRQRQAGVGAGSASGRRARAPDDPPGRIEITCFNPSVCVTGRVRSHVVQLSAGALRVRGPLGCRLAC